MKRLVLLGCSLLSILFCSFNSGACLSHVAIINPITAAIGATVALSTITHKAYQSYIQQYQNNDQKIVLPTDVVLAERSYYEQRKTELINLRQELIYIKNGLENIKAFCNIDPTNFTYQFLQQSNTPHVQSSEQLKISAASEMQLSENQKINLQTLREVELKNLEEEVMTLQKILACHTNELISQVYTATCEYENITKEQTSKCIVEWNNHLNQITDPVALQAYKADLLEEHLLNHLTQKINELKAVAYYYRNHVKSECIKQSTNIIELLEQTTSLITKHDQWIAKEKVRITQNISVSERYFAHRGISIEHIKNETKNSLKKDRNGRNAHDIVEAKNRLESIVVAGGPQKNNNKNDEDDSKERKKNTLTKSEFFKKVKDNYEHYRDGVYRRKRNAKGIADAEYLEWDHLHNDVEAYSKSRVHIGSIDPEKLTLYKGPVYGRDFPLT